MPEAVEWNGLRAVYSSEELVLMADLKAGVRARTVERRELEVLHELKALCRARVVDWMDPQGDPGAPVLQPVLSREPENDESPPQRRLRRHEGLEGQGSFFG